MPEPEAIILTAGIIAFLVGTPVVISYGIYRLLGSRLDVGPWAFAALAVAFWLLVVIALRAAGV